MLAPLGIVRTYNGRESAGYGYPGRDDQFAIRAVARSPASSSRAHLAFTAPNRAAVIAFHAAAIARGAVDEGAPERCSEYGDGYFAAFVRDPDDYRLEAVYHE